MNWTTYPAICPLKRFAQLATKLLNLMSTFGNLSLQWNDQKFFYASGWIECVHDADIRMIKPVYQDKKERFKEKRGIVSKFRKKQLLYWASQIKQHTWMMPPHEDDAWLE